MPQHLNYLGALLACLLVTLPLEWLGDGVYRRPRRLGRALAVPVLIFVAWDVIAAARSHWSYDPGQTMPGPSPLGLPLEEWLFFLVVPTSTLLTYEAVRGLRARWSSRRRPVRERVDA